MRRITFIAKYKRKINYSLNTFLKSKLVLCLNYILNNFEKPNKSFCSAIQKYRYSSGNLFIVSVLLIIFLPENKISFNS